MSCQLRANNSKFEANSSVLYKTGGLAQLARALALQAKGHRFDSDILHKKLTIQKFLKLLM